MPEALKVLLDEGNYSLERQQLLGNRCSSCDVKFFPKRSFCPNCLRKETMEEIVLPNEGTLYTYSTVHVGNKKFHPPYTVGYVDIDPQIRMFGHLVRSDADKMKINQSVRISVGPVGTDGDQTLYGIVFSC